MLPATSSFFIWIPTYDPETYTKIFNQCNSGESGSFQAVSPPFKRDQSSHFLLFHLVYKIQLAMGYDEIG